MPPMRVEMDMKEVEEILGRASEGPLGPSEVAKLRSAMQTLGWLQAEISRKNASLGRLRTLLFGTPTTEKTSRVVGETPKEKAQGEPPEGSSGSEKPSPGHGRNGAADYGGARKVPVPHESLRPGSGCPQRGCSGKVYRLPEPRVLVCVTGQAPLSATVYEREAFRCTLCGKVFVAALPGGVRDRKYDETSAAMIGLLKYGSGMPFNRLEGLEGNLGIPLPAATQWEVVEAAAEDLAEAYEELTRQAAQGEVLHNDDTTMKILEHLAENGDLAEQGERTGTFTSGVVATKEGRRMALFFTGRRHAGENLTKVLSQRERQWGPPIQMCDGLERNLPDEEFETILGNCLAHGRRKFVEVIGNFPEECRHVLLALREVYRNEALARCNGKSAQERLAFHQEKSGPVMQALGKWMDEQFEQKKVEPNSALGDAITYMRKRWGPLTLFLREPGAPLDNNLCERALKKAILHRKNAMFFKTENGAHVGDIFMSLIHTAELSGANPFDYLTELLRHAVEVRDNAEAWMPWNYRQTLLALA